MSRTIDQTELVNLISARVGAFTIGFTAHTTPQQRKTLNPYWPILKSAHINAMVNFHYDTGVLRRVEKEGKSPDMFRQGESWHIAVLDNEGKLTPFCKHKKTGKLYLRVMVLGVTNIDYFSAKKEKLEFDDIEIFLYDAPRYQNQGLDEPLQFLVYSFDNIKQISFDGDVYNLI